MNFSLAKPEAYSEVGRSWYDTKKGVVKHLVTLDDFHFLLDARHYAAYEKKERLNEFFLFGIYYLDSCGNCGKAEKRISNIPDVLTKDEFWHLIEKKIGEKHHGISFSMNGGDIPPEGLKCAHCQQNWTMENCFDTVVRQSTKVISLAEFVGKTLGEVKAVYEKMTDAIYRMNQKCLIRNDRFIDLSPKYPDSIKDWQKSLVKNENGWVGEEEGINDLYLIQDGDESYLDVWVFYHEWCNLEDLLQNQKKIFREIFEKAGFQISEMVPVENEYGSGDWHGPWFLVDTEFGMFKIGWRKRVIKIDWSGVVKTFQFELMSLFEKEEVTQSKNYIHAWGYEKAEEYLKKIFDFLSETQKTV